MGPPEASGLVRTAVRALLAALDRVFDPITTTRHAIPHAAETMRRLGGFIRIESAEGIGTAVHLYFSRLAEPTLAAADDKAAAAAE